MLIGHPKQLNKAKDFPDLEVEDQKLCRAQKIFRNITQEKLMISKFLGFVLSNAKSLLDTREQVPGTRSQSKYETLPH